MVVVEPGVPRNHRHRHAENAISKLTDAVVVAVVVSVEKRRTASYLRTMAVGLRRPRDLVVAAVDLKWARECDARHLSRDRWARYMVDGK